MTPERRAEVERLYGGPLRPEFPHYIPDPLPPIDDPHAPEIFLAEDGSRWAMPPILQFPAGSPRYSGPGELLAKGGTDWPDDFDPNVPSTPWDDDTRDDDIDNGDLEPDARDHGSRK